MKTSELTGAALDWAVAKCEGNLPDGYSFDPARHGYSTNWAKGGPIIEREGMYVNCLRHSDRPVWEAWPYKSGTRHIHEGPTPLIAAMRCYVASRLGDEVTIPEELR